MSAGYETVTPILLPKESGADMAAFWKAWVVMQAALEAVPQDKRNPHLKTTYSSLSAVIEAAAVMHKHGFGYTQCDVGGFLETKIVHESGQWRASYTEIRCSDNRNAAQAYGAGLTYARRYGLTAALGLASVEDDGHSAGRPNGRKSGPGVPEGAILAELATVANLADYEAWAGKWRDVAKRASGDVKARIKGAADRTKAKLEAAEAPPTNPGDAYEHPGSSGDVAMQAWE